MVFETAFGKIHKELQITLGKGVTSERRFCVYVNGYGAPLDPLTDGNLTRYLQCVVDWLDRHRDKVNKVVLCGGFTNRTDLSEAEAMRCWIVRHAPQWTDSVWTIEETLSVRENIQAFAELYLVRERAVFFCERSRLWTVLCLVRHWFKPPWVVTVIGVPFDARAMRIGHRLRQLFFHAPIEWVSLWWSWLDRWREERRHQNILRAREAFARSHPGGVP